MLYPEESIMIFQELQPFCGSGMIGLEGEYKCYFEAHALLHLLLAAVARIQNLCSFLLQGALELAQIPESVRCNLVR